MFDPPPIFLLQHSLAFPHLHFMFICNPPSSFSSVHMCMDTEPNTWAWEMHQWLHRQRMVFPVPAANYQLSVAPQKRVKPGACLPHLLRSCHRLHLCQETPVALSS